MPHSCNFCQRLTTGEFDCSKVLTSENCCRKYSVDIPIGCSTNSSQQSCSHILKLVGESTVPVVGFSYVLGSVVPLVKEIHDLFEAASFFMEACCSVYSYKLLMVNSEVSLTRQVIRKLFRLSGEY